MGKFPSPSTLQGSDLGGTPASWAETDYPFRSQSPLFVLAIFKNCLQINGVATEITRKVLFPPKELNWRNWSCRKALTAQLSRKISRCLFCGYVPWTPGRTGLGGRYAEDIAYENTKTYRNFYFNSAILVLLAGSRHGAVCCLVNWGQSRPCHLPSQNSYFTLFICN